MRTRVVLSAILFVSTLGVAAPPAPITAKQLVAWVVGGMSVDHLAGAVNSRGIAFHADKKYVELMKAAGASDKLLVLLPSAEKSAGAPGTDAAFERLAVAANDLGANKYDAAGKSLVAAVKFEPQNADLFYALGGIFTHVEDWEHATQAYHQATHLSPDFLAAHLGLSYACYRVEDADCAEAESRLVLRSLPGDAEAHKDLGLAYMLRDDPRNAEREFREAIRLKPDYSNAYNNLGMVLDNLHERDAAISAYQQSIRLEPDSWFPYYNLGIALKAKGDHKGAIAADRRANQLNPRWLPARQNLAAELCDSAQYPEAIKELRELLAIDPEWNMARSCLGKSLLFTGNVDEAITVYQEALRQDPSDDDSRVGLGMAFEHKNQIPQALAEFQRAEHDNPDSPYPYWNSGRLEYNQGKFDASSREIEKALRLNPTNGDWTIILARDYMVLRNNARAQELFERAISLLKAQWGESNPKVANAQAELAQLLGYEGKYDQAKPLYLKAIKTLSQAPNPKENGLEAAQASYQTMLRMESGHSPIGPK